MSEFECFILVVFLINCVLNVFVMAYFRTIIKEEKHLDELFTKTDEHFCHVYDYWHKYLIMKEKEKDGLE